MVVLSDRTFLHTARVRLRYTPKGSPRPTHFHITVLNAQPDVVDFFYTRGPAVGSIMAWQARHGFDIDARGFAFKAIVRRSLFSNRSQYMRSNLRIRRPIGKRSAFVEIMDNGYAAFSFSVKPSKDSRTPAFVVTNDLITAVVGYRDDFAAALAEATSEARAQLAAERSSPPA